jgi:hypothetical protein
MKYRMMKPIKTANDMAKQLFFKLLAFAMALTSLAAHAD